MVGLHFAGLEASTLDDYRFERYATDFPNATAGLDIFDGAGNFVFQGREFQSGIAGYWRPAPHSVAREATSKERDWGAAARRPTPTRVG